MSSARQWRSFVVVASTLALIASACSSKNETKNPYRGGYGAYGASAGEDAGGAGNANGGGNAGDTGEASNLGGAGDPGAAGASSGGAATDNGGAGPGNGGASPGNGGAGPDVSGGAGAGMGGADSTGNAGGGNEGGFVNVVPTDGFGSTGALTFLVTTPQRVAVPGQMMLWNITVGNTSTVAIKGVNAMLRMPKGLQLYYTTANPASSYCGNGTCSETEEASWDIGDLAPGMTQTIEIDAAVGTNVGEGDTIAPLFRLQATDLDPLTLTKSVPVHADNPAELTVSASSDPLVSGDEVELAVDVGNIGAATLFTGKLSLTLPGAFSVSNVSDGGSAASAEGLTQVKWSLDSLPVGSTFRRFVHAKLRAGVGGGVLLNPTAAFSHEAATSDLIAEHPISAVTKTSPLVLEVKPIADPVVPNGNLLYNVTISNRSLRAVDGIDLWLRVPPELSYYYTNAEPDSSYCGNGTCSNSELGNWSIGTLAAGTSQTITIDSSVVATSAGDGSLASTAFELRAVGQNPIHAFKTVAVHTKPSAQLVLGTNLAPVTAGQTFSYDVDVGQIGAGSLIGTKLSLQLPAEVMVGSVSDGGSASGQVVSWSLGDVAVASTAHRSVSVTVAGNVSPGSVLSARTWLTFNGGQEVDNVSEHALDVVAEALPLAVTLSASANPTKLGDSLNYTTTIKNTASRTLDGVQLLMRMPAGTSFYYTSADPDSSYCGNGTCSAGEEAVWDLGSIAAGATKTVLITPVPAATLTAGTLLTFRQRLSAVDLGGTMLLETTLATKK